MVFSQMDNVFIHLAIAVVTISVSLKQTYNVWKEEKHLEESNQAYLFFYYALFPLASLGVNLGHWFYFFFQYKHLKL